MFQLDCLGSIKLQWDRACTCEFKNPKVSISGKVFWQVHCTIWRVQNRLQERGRALVIMDQDQSCAMKGWFTANTWQLRVYLYLDGDAIKFSASCDIVCKASKCSNRLSSSRHQQLPMSICLRETKATSLRHVICRRTRALVASIT